MDSIFNADNIFDNQNSSSCFNGDWVKLYSSQCACIRLKCNIHAMKGIHYISSRVYCSTIEIAFAIVSWVCVHMQIYIYACMHFMSLQWCKHTNVLFYNLKEHMLIYYTYMCTCIYAQMHPYKHTNVTCIAYNQSYTSCGYAFQTTLP